MQVSLTARLPTQCPTRDLIQQRQKYTINNISHYASELSEICIQCGDTDGEKPRPGAGLSSQERVVLC